MRGGGGADVGEGEDRGGWIGERSAIVLQWSRDRVIVSH